MMRRTMLGLALAAMMGLGMTAAFAGSDCCKSKDKCEQTGCKCEDCKNGKKCADCDKCKDAAAKDKKDDKKS